MNYWNYAEYDEHGSTKVARISEQEILKRYWKYWYTMMCKKFGKEVVDADFDKSDCIDDWVVVNWAWGA